MSATHVAPSGGDGARFPCEQHDGRVVVHLVGEVDMADADALAAAFASVTGDGAHAVVVDMTGLDFIDSSGLRVLVEAAKRLRGSHDGVGDGARHHDGNGARHDAGDHQERRLVVRGAHGPVRRILEITGLETVLCVDP